jgi:signal transduction histidine kinase
MYQSRAIRLWRASGTVRFRVTVLAAVLVSLALFVGARATLAIQSNEVRGQLEDSLGQRIEQVIEGLKTSEELPTALAVEGDESAAQLVGGNGVVLASSANLAGQPPLAGGFRPQGLRETRELESLVAGDDDRFVVMGERFTRDEQIYTVYLAASLGQVDTSIATLRWSLLIGVPLLAVAATWLFWWLVGRALAPVESVRRTVSEIQADELYRRVPGPWTHDEIGRLVTTMNELLSRIEESQARQMQFVADASQLLRAPLEQIRARLEADLGAPDEANPWETEQLVLTEAIELQELADDLLKLAEVDSEAPMHWEPVDLGGVVFEEIERLRRTWPVIVDTLRVADAQLTGDSEMLRELVANLLDNAAQHARERITVELHEDRRSGWIDLRVDDDGPGVSEEDRERIFERFVRLDDTRRRYGGAGLGLSMVREILERHGGAIRVSTSVEGGARFDVRLPMEQAAREQTAA